MTHQELSPLSPPLLVDRPSALRQMEQALASASRLAVDTESNSLFAYHERVCLIQLSTEQLDMLIDPLSLGSELGALGEVLADPSVEKILHAAEYDVMCLRRDFGFTFANLFDTMIAARVLGWEQVGLRNLLESRFGIKLNKRHQRANWGRRPLPRDMLRYAQMDTHYLFRLRDDLYSLLQATGRLDEATELFREVCSATWSGSSFEPDGFWRINGARDLDPRQAAVLRELYLYREQQARQRDLPPFKILSEDTLLALASKMPTSSQMLHHIPGLGEGQIRRDGPGILEAIQRGLQAPPPSPPDRRNNRLDEKVHQRFEALSGWRKQRAAQRGVPSDIILSRDALIEIAEVAPRTWEQLLTIRSLGPWRRQTYGSEILAILSALDDRNSSAQDRRSKP